MRFPQLRRLACYSHRGNNIYQRKNDDKDLTNDENLKRLPSDNKLIVVFNSITYKARKAQNTLVSITIRNRKSGSHLKEFQWLRNIKRS